MSESDEYRIDCTASTCALGGVMRLESVEAYDRALKLVRDMVVASDRFQLDIRELIFLNSSGIRALGDLVLLAREHEVGLTVLGTSAVPWQRKTLASLQRLYPLLELELS